MFTFRLNVIEAKEKRTETIEIDFISLSLSLVQSEDLDLSDVSKKVCLRAYSSIDKTDESN